MFCDPAGSSSPELHAHGRSCRRVSQGLEGASTSSAAIGVMGLPLSGIVANANGLLTESPPVSDGQARVAVLYCISKIFEFVNTVGFIQTFSNLH